MSTLGIANILRIYSLHIPPAGAWRADLSLDAITLPALGLTSLVVGDLALVGSVTSAAFDDNPNEGRPRVTVEGGAGWRAQLTRKGEYAGANGVRLTTILRDVAALAGELYDVPDEALLSPDYRWPVSTSREPVTGADVLADLMVRGVLPTWRVAPYVAGDTVSTGNTRFDPWPSSGAADEKGVVVARNMERGRRSVALDTRVSAFLPGGTLEGVTIRRLLLTEDTSKLRAEIFQT